MSALTPVLPSPAGMPARADPMMPAMRAERPAPAMRADSAQAVPPVEEGRDPARIRFVDRDGRPVGPPPSFPITLLEAQRQAQSLIPPDRTDRKGMQPGYPARDKGDDPDLIDRKV